MAKRLTSDDEQSPTRTLLVPKPVQHAHQGSGKRGSHLDAITQAEPDHVWSELAHLLDNGVGDGPASLRLVHVQVLGVEGKSMVMQMEVFFFHSA